MFEHTPFFRTICWRLCHDTLITAHTNGHLMQFGVQEEVAELLQQVVGKDSIREPTGRCSAKTGLVLMGDWSPKIFCFHGDNGHPVDSEGLRSGEDGGFDAASSEWFHSATWTSSSCVYSQHVRLKETYFMGYFFALYRNSISSLHMSISLSQIDGRLSFSLCFAGYLGFIPKFQTKWNHMNNMLLYICVYI